jgi:hypothetical protein
MRVPTIQDPVIRYIWDDWNVEAVDMPLEGPLQQRLHSIALRAVAAFAIGTAEWIVYRFARLSSDPAPALRLEAAWAQVVSFRYSGHHDIKLDEWRGPVRGPLGIALRRVIFALDEAEKIGDAAWRAGRAYKLARHVINNPAPYLEWSDHVLSRLEILYPSNPGDPLGDVVPREAMDPDFDFDMLESEALINRFLSGLDYRENPFLNAPQQMFQQGFAGTPYSFRLEGDRHARQDW